MGAKTFMISCWDENIRSKKFIIFEVTLSNCYYSTISEDFIRVNVSKIILCNQFDKRIRVR